MSDKKKIKAALAAANQWQKTQIATAALMQELEKAEATIEEFKHELDELTLTAVQENAAIRRKDVEKFLMDARDSYVAKINEIGEEYFKDIDQVIKDRLAE